LAGLRCRLEKDNIKINLTEDRLEISAETKQEEEKKDKDYVYREMQRELLSRVYSPIAGRRG
jgi:HSP20 family protein